MLRDTIETMIDNGDAIVMGPAGYEVHANFPIQEIIDKFNEWFQRCFERHQ